MNKIISGITILILATMGTSVAFAASGGAGSGISEEQAIAFAIVYG